MHLSRAAQEARDPVLAHGLGLFVAVPDQFDRCVAGGSHHDAIRVGRQGFRTFLQPDVPHHTAAGMNTDCYALPKTRIEVGFHMNRRFSSLQVLVNP